MLSLTLATLYIIMVFVTYPVFRGLWYGWTMNLIDELSCLYSLSDRSTRIYRNNCQKDELLKNRLFSFFESLVWPIALPAHSGDFKYFKGLVISNKLYKG
jgi:hypothetical protein